MFVKILEPEERTAALINLTANMLYLENNAQSQYSEVRTLGLSSDIANLFLFLVNKCDFFIPKVRSGIYACFCETFAFYNGKQSLLG